MPRYINFTYTMLSAADEMIEYKGRPFKIATLSGWTVILSGQQLVEELSKAGDDEMSLLSTRCGVSLR